LSKIPKIHFTEMGTLIDWKKSMAEEKEQMGLRNKAPFEISSKN
jgi:hypothetical protein